MNLNEFAKEVTKQEGLEEAVSIAQVKEIMRIVLTKLASLSMLDLAKILKKYSKKAK